MRSTASKRHLRHLFASGLALVLLAGCTLTVGGSAALPTTAAFNALTTGGSPVQSPVPATGASGVPTTGSALPTAGTGTTRTPLTGVAPPLSTASPSSGGTPSLSASTRNTAPTPRVLSLAELRTQHDAAIDSTLTTLTQELLKNQRVQFLSSFDAGLIHRIGSWFDNTRLLGVAQARLVRMRDYYSQADDRSDSFSRSVVIGIRTPYDDSNSLPGITYSLGLTKTRSGWSITGWRPSYVEDPMNCDCRLSVTHNTTMAVVAAHHDDLQGWPSIALDGGSEGVAWARERTVGSGLSAPRGQVIFLADSPYHWFVNTDRPAERSNATISLVDAGGAYPGQDYSTQSRIVVLLTDSNGDMAPQDARGSLYVADVITHESTHQLMTRNSRLYYDGPDPIDTWIVEGIAVAVEVLHRRDHPETEDAGYPEPDDPRNADRHWLVEHVSTTMPTTAQLYSSGISERNYWYGVAGSVFLYVDQNYGYPAMMKVAGQVYAKNDQSPFEYFPDPDRPGRHLSTATAKARWLQWFQDKYEE